MMKYFTILLAVALTFFLWSKGLEAKYNEELQAMSFESPVVVELFTSQSCSSCPPADAILKDLSAKDNVITLGFHVTYWNHLSWQDTVSKEFSTKRQRAYSASAGSNRVYTPQMIVNGRTQFVGSHEAELTKALKNRRPIETVSLSKDRGFINISLPSIRNMHGQAKIWYFASQSEVIQPISSGENIGKTIEYSNAVLWEESLGDWNGQHKMLTAQIPNIEGIDTITVLVQQNGNGPILAAGQTKF